MTTSIPVWTWRDAIRKSKAPALTKHVCNCIANYLSDVGEGCYPGVKALMDDSGLSNRSVATHIETAQKFGLLHIVREVGKDGRFKRTFYFPRFPDNTTLPREPASHGPNHVNEIHSDRPDEPASHGPRERRGKNRVKEVHCNYPIEISKDAPTGASEELICDLESEGKAGWVEIHIDRDKPAWAAWGGWLIQRKRIDDLKAATAAKRMRVPHLKPHPGSPYPEIPRPPSHIIAPAKPKAEARA